MIMLCLQEEAKALKKRNEKALRDILSKMPKVNYRTTWQKAQRLLLKSSDFISDTELQSKIIPCHSRITTPPLLR